MQDLRLRSEGIAVLGIQRENGSFAGVPNGSTVVEVGDILILYGHKDLLGELSRRVAGPDGDRHHQRLVEEHEAAVKQGG